MPNCTRAHLRHAQYYETVARAANNLYHKRENWDRGLGLFDSELEQIQAEQRWAAANIYSNKQAMRLSNDYPEVAAEQFEPHLPVQRWVEGLEVAITAARWLKERECEGIHLNQLGGAHSNLGEGEEAVKCYEQALAIARELGDQLQVLEQARILPEAQTITRVRQLLETI